MSEEGIPDLMYTVQPADISGGLMALALRFYGDDSRWFELYSANRGVIGSDPTLLHTGQQLVVPVTGTEGVHVLVYLVVPNDVYVGLRGIADRFYGDAERWQELYAVNRGVIGDDPQQLQPGQQLLVLDGRPARNSVSVL